MDDQGKSSELARLYTLAEACDVTLPSGVARKIELLSRVQVILGRYAADAVREYKRIYAQRKREHAEAALKVKRDKIHHAEVAVSHLRLQEAEAEADKVRWNNAFQSNQEIINSLKYTLKTMLAEDPGRGG